MTNYAKTLQKTLGELFLKSGLSQAEFGKKTGLTQAKVSQALNGRLVNCELKTLEKVGKAFGKSVLWLLSDPAERPDDINPIARRIKELKDKQIKEELHLSQLRLEEEQMENALNQDPFVDHDISDHFTELSQRRKESDALVASLDKEIRFLRSRYPGEYRDLLLAEERSVNRFDPTTKEILSLLPSLDDSQRRDLVATIQLLINRSKRIAHNKKKDAV